MNLIKYLVNFLCVLSSAESVSLKYLKIEGKLHGSGADVEKDLNFKDSSCNSLEPESLAEIMGPAYNPRYMSVNPPIIEDMPKFEQNFNHGNWTKRKASGYNQFFVDNDFAQEVDDKPAWEANHFINTKLPTSSAPSRTKRSASRPWECLAVVKWIDLGTDYFPRYLRTVECTKHKCWYDKFTCQARSFTIKLLRRKQGKCVYHDDKKIGTVGLPKELRELWVWEERAVNFCCDCAHS